MERAPRLASIVLPTYNERANLPRVLAAIEASIPWPFEVVVVDDNSPDGTADLARELADEHPVRLLSRPRKAGLGSAYRDGFAVAQGDLIFEMDADLSHHPHHLKALGRAVLDGADIAVGSRYVLGGRIVGWGRYRRLVSGVGNGLARTALRLDVRDTTSGFRCYSRAAADLVRQARSDGYAFQVEALHLARRHGMRIVEVPITFENRRDGKSKLGPAEFASFLRAVARLSLTRAGAARRPARAP